MSSFSQSWCRCGSGIYTFSDSFYSLYFLYIWKNLLTPIPVSILLFIDNRLFVSQKKSYEKSNVNLFYSYNIISSLFNQFNLVIKHDKSEVLYFMRSTKDINLLLLDLGPLGGPLLWPKNMWWYLGFFFDKKLSFY